MQELFHKKELKTADDINSTEVCSVKKTRKKLCDMRPTPKIPNTEHYIDIHVVFAINK
jgi:hypothetical protein